MFLEKINALLKNLIFALFTALLFCLFFEFIVFLGLRISLGAGGLELFRVKYGRIEGPSIQLTAQGDIDFPKNKFGFFGPEFKLQKPKNTFRMLIIGASAVSGELARALRNALSLQCPAQHCEVLDGGVPGSSSAHEYYYLQRWLAYSPDLVIVYDGENDVYYSHYAVQSYLDETKAVLRRARRWHRIDYWFIRHSYAVQVIKALPDKFQGLRPIPPAFADEAALVKTDWFGRKNSYAIDLNAPVQDHFSELYKNHLIQMAQEAIQKNTAIIFFLQPALVAKLGRECSENEKVVLRSFPVKTSDDWLRSTEVLYLAADQAQRTAQQTHGQPYFDLSRLGDSADFKFFEDLVHLTREGNQKAAQAIVDACKKANVLKVR